MHRTFPGAIHARRLAVIARLMRTAPGWQLTTLVVCWLREVGRT